jgi:protease II
VVLPREHDVDYGVDHWHGALFMTKRTSNTPNSELFIVPISDPSQQRLLLEHRHGFKIEDIALSGNFVAVLERSASTGLQECRVFALPNDKDPARV